MESSTRRKKKLSIIARHYRLSIKTVSKWIQQYKEQGEIEEKSKSGCPKKTTLKQDKKMISLATLTNIYPTLDILRRMPSIKSKVSRTTIWRRLKEAQLEYKPILKKPLLSSVQMKKRVIFANNYNKLDWSQVIFTDEVSFQLMSTPNKAWTQPGERKIGIKIKHP